MENPSPTKLTDEPSPSPKPPWWKRGLFSPNGMIGQWFHKLLGRFFQTREMVSDSAIFLHGRAMTDIRVLGKNAELIDNEKFGQEEFLVFIKLKYLLSRNIGDYANLYESIRLLQLAIDAKDSFIAIDQTELSFRGSKQQDFYKYTEDLLGNYENIDVFRENIQVKLSEVIAQVKTEEGRVALQAYSKHLNRLCEDDLGLKLLSLFKAFQLADYSVLRQISDLIKALDKQDLQSYSTLISLVMANYNAFESLRKIIKVSDRNHNPDNYARMVQYIALNYRHGLSFIKFDELMSILKRWYRPYQTLIGIREAHPPHLYKQPLAFQEPIAGESTYFKYVNWLTDKKAGITYIDFETD